MSVEKVLREKMDKATSAPTQINVGRINASDLIAPWVDNTEQALRFKTSILNLTQVLGEKVQFLIAGKPIVVDNQEFKDLKKFVDEIELQETLYMLIGVLFDNFTGHVVIEKLDDKVYLRIADPKFPNVVYKIGKIPYKAEVWTAFKFERAQYWKQTIYTNKTIENKLFSEKDGDFSSKKQVDVKDFNKKLNDTSLSIKPKQDNDWGFIPVEQVQWLPSYDMSTAKTINKSPKDRIEPLQIMFDEATHALRRELYLNRTKIMVDQTLLDKNQAKTIADESIIAVLKDTGDYDDKNKVFEIIQGDPKVEQYWTNINKIITMAVQSLKLSEIQEGGEGGGPATATEAIFNRGNDVETANTLSLFHQKTLKRILAKAKAMYENETVSETELDLEPWSVQIIPNVIMNEAKMTEVVVAQLGAGLINMVQAKVKLEGISQTDAEESLSQDEQFNNPTLMASASMSGDGDEEPSKPLINQNNGKDVTEAK